MLCTREIVVNKDGSSQFKSSSPGTFFWRVVGPFVLCCEPPTFNPCFCLLRADTSCLHHMGPSLSNFVLKHIYLPSPPIMSLFRLEVSQGNRNYFGYFKQEGIYFREIVFFFSNRWKSWRVEAQSKSSFVLRTPASGTEAWGTSWRLLQNLLSSCCRPRNNNI